MSLKKCIIMARTLKNFFKENIMAKVEDRFKRIYKQGVLDPFEIWVDTETGVNYIYRQCGHSGGMTLNVLFRICVSN